MRDFLTLFKMQMRCRLRSLIPSKDQGRSKQARRALGMAVLFLFAGASVLWMLIEIYRTAFSAMHTMGIEEMLISFAVLVSMTITLVMSLFYVTSVMYMGKDAELLASLPVSSRSLFYSKFVQVIISEIGFAIAVVVPAVIIYGIGMGMGALFYIKLIPVILFLPCIPICIVNLVAMLLVRVSSFFKRKEGMTTVIGFLALLGYMYVCMNFSSWLPTAMDGDFMTSLISNQRGMLEGVINAIPPCAWASKGITLMDGSGVLYMLLFVGVSALCVFLTGLVFGGIYQRLSLAHLAVGRVTNKKYSKDARQYKEKSPVFALFIREWKEILRVPTYALNSLMTLIMGPLMMVAFYVGFNNNVDAGTQETIQGFLPMLENMLRTSGIDKGIIVLAITAFFGFICGINSGTSTIVSREGKTHELFCMMPLSASQIMRSKVLFGLSISLPSVIVTGALMIIIAPSLIDLLLPGLLLSIILATLFTYLNVLIDVIRPQLSWTTFAQAMKQNMNSLFGMLICWAVAILLGVVAYFLISGGIQGMTVVLIFGIALTAAAVGAHFLLNHIAAKRYYDYGG
ncbi:MAG: hypothetical protein PHI27_01155 [Eubacteriales bacterium]|nr:hypothetical protein [Eubacteriales bacterium]MDD3880842.1 hypothetical protein [Eubacteriales bacterium]MDD4511791.1 hypothetical protein [Eubacteriales bacterium]